MVAPDLPREAEVVVVGGGCMGTSIAFHLARRDVDVVLLVKSHVAGGAKGHSGRGRGEGVRRSHGRVDRDEIGAGRGTQGPWRGTPEVGAGRRRGRQLDAGSGGRRRPAPPDPVRPRGSRPPTTTHRLRAASE